MKRSTWNLGVWSIVGMLAASAQGWPWPPTLQSDQVRCEAGATIARISMGGTWWDTCVPTGMDMTVRNNRIDVFIRYDYPDNVGCGDALTDWRRSASVPITLDATHDVYATLTRHGVVLAGPTLMSPLIPRCDCASDVDDGFFTGQADGGVTIDDLIFFLYVFDLGDLAADLDDGSYTGMPDGGVTIDDLMYYLYRFSIGC